MHPPSGWCAGVGEWHGGRPTLWFVEVRRAEPNRSARPAGPVEPDTFLWALWREGMPPTTTSPAGTVGNGLRGLVLPIIIVGAILVFVVPIPPELLDVLLSVNLTVAVLVLLTTLTIRAPQEFSALPDDPAHDHADAAGPERRDHEAGAHAGRRKRGRCGRRRDPGVRRVRRRRPGDRRGDPVLDPGGDPVRGDHAGCDAHQRGRRAVHARRPAGPADGDRRRPARRVDRPA